MQSIRDIPVYRREDFLDDYTKEILPTYQRNVEDLLDNIVASLIDSPDSYQHVRVSNEMSEDGLGKLFTFTSYQAEDGVQIHYVGVADE